MKPVKILARPFIPTFALFTSPVSAVERNKILSSQDLPSLSLDIIAALPRHKQFRFYYLMGLIASYETVRAVLKKHAQTLAEKERRTKEDFAHFIKYLVDEVYPEAEKLVLVLDNLNTYTPGSFYQVFAPEEAMRLWKKLEIHYTPLHGSWLNMAEFELSVLGRQALIKESVPAEKAPNEV